MDFKDKVVLVTGAGRGIGKAIALAFAKEGARVAVNDINPGSCETTAQEINSIGGEAAAWQCDVANKMGVQTMLIDIEDRWRHIDILINNAGVEPHKSILTMDEWDWDRTFEVNLKAAFVCAQSVGRMMRDRGGGTIVNVASIAGRAAGLKDRSAYVASKAGLIGFTKECAREFAPYNIRVNAVCPGVIITEMTAHLRDNEEQMKKWLADIPAGRLGDPSDVTGLVLFLCSDAARYITGQAIHVDGGKVMI